MIAWLQGKLHSISTDSCVILTSGIGYEVLCSSSTLADVGALPSEQGRSPEVSLFIHTHVREDTLQLFGFSTSTEKQMFLSLNKVSGIGPKSALQILSGSTVREITRLVEGEDVKALSQLPKVGKKTAEQMILTLKGKLVVESSSVNSGSGSKVNSGEVQVKVQIRSALVNLGFRGVDVEKVVEGLSGLSFEEGLRQGLAALTHI